MSASHGATFVDTNVLVYAVDETTEGKPAIARKLLRSEMASTLVLSTQVLSEFYVVVTRKLAVPMPAELAARAVSELARLPVVATDTPLIERAIAICREAQLSFWDALIVAAAERAGCSTILTEDLNAGQRIAGIEVVDPFAAG